MSPEEGSFTEVINYLSCPEKSTWFPTLRSPFEGKKRGCFTTSTTYTARDRNLKITRGN